MSSRKNYVSLRGSERAPLPGARAVGAANADERIEVSLALRSRSEEIANADQIHALKQTEKLGALPINEREYLSREDFEQKYGADPNDVAKVEEFAHENGLAVAEIDLARRIMTLTGTVSKFSQAFNVELVRYQHDGGEYRGRTGAISIPEELNGIVLSVHGLDNRPQAKPHFRTRAAGALASGAQSYTPPQIASLYDFPTKSDGARQCIALIELGGGYRVSDLNTYFHSLQITPPKVTAVSVDGGHNHPTHDGNGPDGEVMLDIEVAGAVAPGAHIVVYFAPNTDKGFLDAISKAIFDKTHNPTVVSISWGGPESAWTQQSLTAFDQSFQDAARLGVTVCCAAGDNGSTDGVTDGLQHVDFPASSPHVLACGGTRLESANGKITTETVWDDGPDSATGGGISYAFPIPDWQSGAHVPVSANPGHNIGRGMPDVSGDADPNTGYEVRVDGQPAVIGGTSAVAPLWAALTALINQSIGKPLGYFNPLLYGTLSRSGAFHDITQGNNGAYTSGKGWDPCTGWGTPDGSVLQAGFTGKPAAKAARPGKVA